MYAHISMHQRTCVFCHLHNMPSPTHNKNQKYHASSCYRKYLLCWSTKNLSSQLLFLFILPLTIKAEFGRYFRKCYCMSFKYTVFCFL
jgi:hypothetical protein